MRVRQETQGKSSGYQWAVRLGTEMVSATCIGVAMGYTLDRWLGTQPWMTVVLFLFGVAAGFLNLYRAVQEATEGEQSEPGQSEPGQSEPGRDRLE